MSKGLLGVGTGISIPAWLKDYPRRTSRLELAQAPRPTVDPEARDKRIIKENL